MLKYINNSFLSNFRGYYCVFCDIKWQIKVMKKFFWFCSGANRQILDTCPESEQTKFVGIGATVFFTALLASMSGGYAMDSFANFWCGLGFVYI